MGGRGLRHFLGRIAALLALLIAGSPAGAATWGADYFPNVTLTTHDGEEVRFFDDVIENKIVAINFIFTTCVDSCPLETAQLVRVQDILGPRLGADIHFYSITIDPEHDTPAVLKDYRERFGAQWTFLTGVEADITLLRQKLGLYIEEIQDGSNNHNVSMIIGNQATDRWMKRSPFENPYVLADQLGNWLAGWTAPPSGRDYAEAPELRSIARGEQIFRTRCASCHSMTGQEPANALGPDLIGVTERRPMEWLVSWLRAPEQMLARRDPTAMALYEQYNRLAMPNARLNQTDTAALIEFFQEETQRLNGTLEPQQPIYQKAAAMLERPEAVEDLVAVMSAWVRPADPAAPANAGYMTLVNIGSKDLSLVNIDSPLFAGIEMHETVIQDGAYRMREVANYTIPAGSQLRLEPGGKHLMLKNPNRPLAIDQAIDFTLHFASGRQQKLSLKVVDR